jgi:gamma-glutamyltranspeptidase/glutathione hydrolase
MFDFPSRRSVIRARQGLVATSQPLASAAGLRVLLDGGNAIDASIAAAAVQNVVEPMSTGIGGDMFALVWIAREQKLYALNGSGRAPGGLDIPTCRALGARESVPLTGWLPVTVPGAVDGWAQLLDRFGTATFSEVLAPAITYAEQGFPVSELIAEKWQSLQPKLDMSPSAARVYLYRDEPPRAGDIHTQPDLAWSLRQIAEGGRDAFYEGEIARRIAAYAYRTGGFLTREDFKNHVSTWDEPVATTYRDATIYECPPNGQGIVALMALNILEGFDIPSLEHNGPAYLHLVVESLKLAFADAFAHVADPRCVPVPTEKMLNRSYAAERRALIDPAHALADPVSGIPRGSDTVYLSVVDAERNCVSFINSLYQNFGSGIVIPETGICLQDRGANFSLDSSHPNALAPGKRPYHTLIPAIAFRDAAPWMVFGVMGAFMQPQGHVQVILNTVDFGMDPQRALDSPRVRVFGDNSISLEDAFDNDTRAALSRMGHRIVPGARDQFGGGQIIMLDREKDALLGGSDPRKDGCAIGY